MAVEVFGNLPTTTVTSGGNTAPAAGTQETWTVASSTGFPAVSSSATPPTQIHIADIALNSEIIQVINISGTTWTVIRGAESTTPVAHGAGFTIYQVVSAGAYAQLRSTDWLNVVTQFGADSTGATDATTAINNALAAVRSEGQTVYLPAGTYLVNSSSALLQNTKGTVLCGDGPWSTAIKIGGSFTGAEVISIGAPFCTVRDLQITGASATIASNPAAVGIEIQPGSFNATLQNLLFANVNGYCIEGTNADGHNAISHGIYHAIAANNCAGGIHFSGNQATVGAILSDIEMTGSNSASNLDGLFIEDAFDVTGTNVNIGAGNGGTGHAVHIKGNCQNLWFSIMDCGGFPEPLVASQCGVFIEQGPNGNPSGTYFSHGVFQTFGQGAQVDGGSRGITFDYCWFKNNVTHGATASGGGSQINFRDCTFQGNGSGASGTNYDLNISGTPDGWVRDCHFLSPIVSTGTSGVQNAVNSSGGNMLFDYCEFLGTGSGLSSIFNGLPAHVRQCKNYNPHGSVTVTVPGSGTASTALHYDSWYYITASTANSCTIVRNTNGQGGGVGPTVTVPAGACVPVFVTAQQNLTPTYSGSAPTWVVDGL